MIKRIKILLPAICLLCLTQVKAQMVVGSAEVQPDAYTEGFAGAAVALDANAMSVHRNTAAIIFGDTMLKTEFSYGLSSLYGDDWLHSVGGYYRINSKNIIALGVRYYKADEILNTEDGINYTEAKPYDLFIDLGYGYKLNDYLALSLNLKYVYSKINAVPEVETGNTVAVDLGAYYKRGDYTIGAAVSNLGMLINYGTDKYRMPANLKLGGAYRYMPAPKHLITGTLEGRYNFMPKDFNYFSAGAGLEYRFNGMAALRGGYHLSSQTKSVGNYGSVGCGAYIGPVAADFAYCLSDSDESIMNDVWKVSLGVRF